MATDQGSVPHTPVEPQEDRGEDKTGKRRRKGREAPAPRGQQAGRQKARLAPEAPQARSRVLAVQGHGQALSESHSTGTFGFELACSQG